LLLALTLMYPRIASSGLQYVDTLVDGEDGVDGISGTYSLALSPDGSHLYATDFNDNAISVFDRDPTSGQLSFVQLRRDAVNGDDVLFGADAVVVSPDGSHVYATGYFGNVLAGYLRDAVSGELTYIAAHRQGVDGVDGLYRPDWVALSPDGDRVYVVSRSGDSLAVFERDATTGELAFLEAHKDGVNGVDGLDGAVSVTVSPDNTHIYVAGADDDAVAVFSRDAATGALAFVGAVFDGLDGVDGIRGAQSVTLSADGAQVYVVGFRDWAVTTFDRDPITGELDFVGAKVDGSNGVSGIAQPTAVAVSPEGLQVFVVGVWDHTLAVFDRDTDNGVLSFVESKQDNVDILVGLEYPRDVVVSPDGKHVYIAAYGEDALAIFARTDLDGDGVPNETDNCPALRNEAQADSDGDDLGDACDSDDDNDGVPDAEDDYPTDPTRSSDTDADGVDDLVDNCPAEANRDQADADGDSAGDVCDDDDDNDGVPDAQDDFPTDPARSRDTDGDGIDDNADLDDDNDGIPDVDEIAAGRNPLINESAVLMTILNQLL
jgi:6-phosphogluconolactonase (cycloisomerase 2 family)